MTIDITLNQLPNLQNETTAVTSINQNSSTIQTAFTSALNTAGDTMQGSLDMNNQQILNLPVPGSMDSPVRLVDIQTLEAGTPVNVNVPPPATTTPNPLGTAAVGTSINYARADHVHTNQVTTQSHGDNSTNIASTAYVQAERLNPSGPLEFGNSVNTLIQTAAAGVGGNNSSSENIAFYDADGSLLIGPGSRTDLEVITSSPFNLFINHNHLKFKQPAFSGSRPSAQTLWTATGAGTFAINPNTSFGGVLQINTNTSAAGDGGEVQMDYGSITLSGSKTYALMYPSGTTDQVINFGLFFDVSNQVWLSRSDLSSQGNWVAHCMAAGTTTSTTVSSSLNSGTNRTIFGIDCLDGVNVNFWVGNTNNTIVSAATINTNVPNVALSYIPYISFFTQGAAVARTLTVTDWYTISND